MERAEQDRLAARERRRERRLKMALTVMWLALLAAGTFSLTGWRGVLDDAAAVAVLIALAATALVAAAAGLAFAPGVDRQRLQGLGGRRDREQRARTAQLTVLPASLLVLILVGSLNARRMLLEGERDSTALLPALLVALLVVLPPVMVMGWDGGARKLRRYLEDELTREFRARAIATGFWVLLPGVVAAYLIGLWRPADAVVLLPMVLWAGGAAAALRFAALHRSAEPDVGTDG